MSEFREIWAQAIQAGQEMTLTPAAGDRPFEKLLKGRARDGMVFYERGEAYEYLNKLESAERDYAKAERLLPLEHWKEVARRSLLRVRYKHSRAGVGPGAHLQWDAFHDVHTLPRLQHKLRVRALSALARIDSEVDSALTDLRSCLEEVLVEQLQTVPRAEWSYELTFREKTGVLQSRRGVPNTVARDMQLLWRIGNKAAHPDGSVERRDADSAIKCFVRVLRHFYAGR